MIKDLLTDDELADLEFSLAADPQGHPVVPGAGGVRKARWSRSGMGKRGGIRVIYFYVARVQVVLLIAAYAKNVQEKFDQCPEKQNPRPHPRVRRKP